ncbi:hypothetical protein [Leptospira noguchii]|nr:hypothetical protein [Leptospira noguchii]
MASYGGAAGNSATPLPMGRGGKLSNTASYGARRYIRILCCTNL